MSSFRSPKYLDAWGATARSAKARVTVTIVRRFRSDLGRPRFLLGCSMPNTMMRVERRAPKSRCATGFIAGKPWIRLFNLTPRHRGTPDGRKAKEGENDAPAERSPSGRPRLWVTWFVVFLVGVPCRCPLSLGDRMLSPTEYAALHSSRKPAAFSRSSGLIISTPPPSLAWGIYHPGAPSGGTDTYHHGWSDSAQYERPTFIKHTTHIPDGGSGHVGLPHQRRRR